MSAARPPATPARATAPADGPDARGPTDGRPAHGAASGSGLPPADGSPGWARWLGYAGLLPFAGPALVVALGAATPWQATAASVLLAYAVTIAAFLGGVHWGVALQQARPATLPLVWGVMPQLLAWALWLALPTRAALLGAAGLLVVCWIVDRRLYPACGLGAWLPLRLQLTLGASVCCALAAAMLPG